MWSDLRLACRQVIRHPGTAGVAILSLAIAMSVNTLAFSAVNAFLFKGRAGWDIEGMGRIDVAGVGSAEQGLSAPEFEILADAAGDALVPAAQGRLALAWQRPGATESVWALVVSSSYFEILEERALVGRLFMQRDDAAPAAVVSERFWRDRLNAAPPGPLEITLNGVVTPVIGVLPDTHEGPGGLYAPQVWVRYESRRLWAGPSEQFRKFDDENTLWLSMLGRLRPGTSVAEIDARLQAGAAAIARAWPRTHARRQARFSLLSEWVPELQAIARASIAVMGAVGVVLLIACFNVATLLLARALERDREMGIRAALGASRARLLRQQVTEGLVLAALAAVLAAVVANWSQQLLSAFAIPITVPQRLNVSPDGRVAAFLALMTLVGGILPALAPALRPVTQMLTAREAPGAGGRRAVTRHVLVVLQVTGSTAFLAVATLFVQSFLWTRNLDPGFEDERAVAITLDPGAADSPARAQLSLERIIESLRDLPGVVAVAAADRLPLYIGFPRRTEIAKRDSSCASGGCEAVQTYAIGPGFFRALNVPMIGGREFGTTEGTGVIVNRTLAEQVFGRSDVVGEVLAVGAAGESRVIVGVARDMLQRSFVERPASALYEPLTAAAYARPLMLVAQTAGEPAPLVRAMAARIYEIDPSIAVESIQTMSARLEMPRWPMRAASLFFAICGTLALFLATVGLAAVMSHSVARRMREFGVRVAVGARRGQLLGGVLSSSLRVVAVGVGAGLLAGALLGRALQAILVGVDASNPLPYVAVAAVQAIVAIAASLLPARRAAAVDPMTALRAE
jgi:putative ABC transport system permease protein